MPLGYNNNPSGANGWGTTRPQLSLEDRISANTQKTDTCWFWTGHLDKDGYGSMKVNNKWRRVTHLVYEIVNKQLLPPGTLIRHKCDVRNCINPDHLELGTHADNVRDKMDRGRWRGNQKLTQEAIFSIRQRGQAGECYTDLAAEYKISYAQIHRICGDSGYRKHKKLTETQRSEIIQKYQSGEKQTKLAVEYGITQAAVSYIVTQAKIES